jgi:Protein of unknown function (DUF3999)
VTRFPINALGAKLLTGLVSAFLLTRAGAALPAEWRHEQQFGITNSGLIKLSLPVETLDAARPGLEDLRLFDEAGKEVPYLIERPAPTTSPRMSRHPKSFQVLLNPSTTVVTLETGVAEPIDGLSVETPAENFIKALRIEGSADHRTWRPVAEGQPVFRQPSGASQLNISFRAGMWPWLRLTIEDQRSRPIPFTGARLHVAAAAAAPGESEPATIVERNETPGQTRLTLNLGAANLSLASVTLETDEPLFTRAATLVVPQISENSIRERPIGQGVIYRVAIEGQPASANLSIPLGAIVPSRELVVLINNQDSPPLAIQAASIERRPIHLVFLAREPGTFYLLTGNKTCAAPRYDLAAFDARLKSAVVAPTRLSAVTENPDYHAPEPLSGLEVAGAALDVSAWSFRKPVQLVRGGAQRLELDLDTLAHASADFSDLRLLHGSNQVPYIVERTSVSRPLTLAVTATIDAKDPKVSRWVIKLPRAGLPLTQITCAAKTPLFQRQMSLSEELSDERGDKYRRSLGEVTWTQTPGRKQREFSLPLSGAPQSDLLFLETQNGDNPPIELEQFTAFFPVTRVLFKAKSGQLFAYYGNPAAAAPSYDLSLVAGELLAADKAAATLGAEEELKASTWNATRWTTENTGMVFWVILAAVVAGLLAIIARLLPNSPPST